MSSLKVLPSDWREIQRCNFRSWDLLADYLELNGVQREQILQDARFPLNLPRRLAEKMAKGTLDDPLLRQFLPLKEELVGVEGFVEDPVGDGNCMQTSKLLQKYSGRVLLVATSSCAMHCRFCFRQNFNYDVSGKTFEAELAVIREDETLQEVILSGGDPLSLSNRILQSLIEALAAIPHVKKLRIHTRFPLGIPERIDQEFLDLLEKSRLQVWFAIHCNHPRELDEEILGRLLALRRRGIVVLNQTVLLRGVNDDEETLVELSDLLTDNGIFPYYLHQLDRVRGTAHFEVSEERGRQLVDALRKKVPGYAVPLYVREIAGKLSKTPLV